MASPLSPTPRIAVVDGRHKHGFFALLREALPGEWSDVESGAFADPARLPAFDLVLTNDESGALAAQALPGLAARGVPSLHLADGVLEWRNCFAHPRDADEQCGMPLMRPLQSSKFACLGASQARLLEAWGNVGRVEITGSPRFDPLGATRRCQAPPSAPRVLVASARTPGFDAAQRAVARQAFLDLSPVLAALYGRGRIRELVWRLSEPLADIPGAVTTGDPPPLAEQLAGVDLVVCQPSTVAIEAMILGKPVVLIDYSGVPELLRAAWHIREAGAIARVLDEVLEATPERCWWQDFLVADQVRADGAATARVVALATAMIAAGRSARASGEPLQLPARMLPAAAGLDHAETLVADLAALAPRHPLFARQDQARLAAELGNARLALAERGATIERILRSRSWRMLSRLRALWPAVRGPHS